MSGEPTIVISYEDRVAKMNADRVEKQLDRVRGKKQLCLADLSQLI